VDLNVAHSIDLGAAVRRLRLDQGLTQAQLAEKAGVSRRWLGLLESGTHWRAEFSLVAQTVQALDGAFIIRAGGRDA
jgi:transcriptional regulator with XRE-family HTH domain